MFAGGPIGDGGFWQSWIHVADQVGILRLALENPRAQGPINATAPDPVRNRDLARALGRVLRRPSLLVAPAFAVRAALGEMAEVVLASQRVVPRAGARARIPVPLAVARAGAPRPAPRGVPPMTERPLKLAVVGATGSVGRAVLEDLEAREIPVELRLFATARSEVDLLEFRGDELEVETLSDRSFRGCDAAILAVPAAVARELAPQAWADGLPGHRPLGRLPLGRRRAARGGRRERRRRRRRGGRGASWRAPSGPVVPLALALAPIHREAGHRSGSSVTILQAASGSGRAGLRQLEKEMVALLNGEEPDPSDLSHRVGFNLVPQVGAF